MASAFGKPTRKRGAGLNWDLVPGELDASIPKWFDGDLSAPASSPPAVPQRLPYWVPAASLLVALGAFDAPEIRASNTNALHAFRGVQVQANGHFLTQSTRVVLVEGELEIRRADHSGRLFFGRSSSSTPTGAPWYLTRAAQSPIADEDALPRPHHALLHRYRTGFQTVSQPLTTWPPYRAPQAHGQDEAARSAQADLHRYRFAFQTVGQPWSLLSAAVRSPPEEHAARTAPATDLSLFRLPPAGPTVPQPWLAYRALPLPQLEAEVIQPIYGDVTLLLFGRPQVTPPTPPVDSQPPSAGSGVPGKLGGGMGPYKRPGQVFGAQDPISSFASSRASATIAPQAEPAVARTSPPAAPAEGLQLAPPPARDEDALLVSIALLEALATLRGL